MIKIRSKIALAHTPTLGSSRGGFFALRENFSPKALRFGEKLDPTR